MSKYNGSEVILSFLYLSVNEMHDGLLKVVIDNNFDAIYSEYYKRCICILLKMYKADFKDNDIYRQIQDYLSKNDHYSFIKYKKYDPKIQSALRRKTDGE